jgi:hypothetical protein
VERSGLEGVGGVQPGPALNQQGGHLKIIFVNLANRICICK